MKWTSHQEAEVARRWQEGANGPQIAEAMHLTIGQVMGRLNKLGLLGGRSTRQVTRLTLEPKLQAKPTLPHLKFLDA